MFFVVHEHVNVLDLHGLVLTLVVPVLDDFPKLVGHNQAVEIAVIQLDPG